MPPPATASPADVIPTIASHGTAELAAAVEQLSTQDLVVVTCYAVVALAVTLELTAGWRRPGRTSRLHEAAAAAAMAAGGLAVGVGYTLVFRLLWERVGAVAPSALPELWASEPLLAFVLAFVAWDASGYVYHRIGHHTGLGWAAHRAHHTGREYQLALGLRLSWFPFLGLLHHPLLALAGWDFSTIVICAAVSNLLQALQHSSAAVPVPRWLRAVAMTPEQHRHHHAVGGDTVNLGPVLTCWDRLAGTYRSGPVPAGTRYGLDGAGATNPLAAELDGLRSLLAPRLDPARSTG